MNRKGMSEVKGKEHPEQIVIVGTTPLDPQRDRDWLAVG
jgi:hypothetical protein